MPTGHTDQFFYIDAFDPPNVGDPVNVVTVSYTDQDDDGFMTGSASSGVDTLDGLGVVEIFVGDVVVIDVPGVGEVTYVGATFILPNGDVLFTPTDGQLLQSGTFVSSDALGTAQSVDISDLGPPCFTPGTLILTVNGEVPVETLVPGDMVVTVDHGPQPVRWIGRRTVTGVGDMAPVRIEAGALGNRRDLLVSPQHRMLLTGWQAELHCGEPEVLVPAKHLTFLPGICEERRRTVTYIHLLFDRHEIVLAEGAPSESLYPGTLLYEEDPALRAEIEALFPEGTGLESGLRAKVARPAVRGFEARLMFPAEPARAHTTA